MAFLLDTNFISETAKPQPDAAISRWLFGKTQEDLYLSAVTIAEIRRGVELLDEGKRKRNLDHWLTVDVPHWFGDHILSIDAEVADRCGRLLAEGKRKGWNMEAMDALIAATAQVHDLTLATLNRKHFEKLGVRLLTL